MNFLFYIFKSLSHALLCFSVTMQVRKQGMGWNYKKDQIRKKTLDFLWIVLNGICPGSEKWIDFGNSSYYLSLSQELLTGHSGIS